MVQNSIYDRIMGDKAADDTHRRSGNLGHDAQSGHGQKKWVVISALSVLLLLAGVSVVLLRHSNPFESLAEWMRATPVAAMPQASVPDSPFLTHAKEAGLKTCATVFPVLGQLLAEGAEYTVLSEWNGKEPDQHPVQALVGLDYKTGEPTGSGAGLVFAVPNGSSCDGTMVRVTPIAASCDSLPATFPKGSQLTRNLGKSSVYALANNGGQALLLPSGASCIVLSVARVSAP